MYYLFEYWWKLVLLIQQPHVLMWYTGDWVLTILDNIDPCQFQVPDFTINIFCHALKTSTHPYWLVSFLTSCHCYSYLSKCTVIHLKKPTPVLFLISSFSHYIRCTFCKMMKKLYNCAYSFSSVKCECRNRLLEIVRTDASG